MVPCYLNGKESACNVGDPSTIPRSGRFTGEGIVNPFQYSCLENSMDRGAQWAPWGCKESDTTEQLTHTYKIFSSIAAPAPPPDSFGTYHRTNLDTA